MTLLSCFWDCQQTTKPSSIQLLGAWTLFSLLMGIEASLAISSSHLTSSEANTLMTCTKYHIFLFSFYNSGNRASNRNHQGSWLSSQYVILLVLAGDEHTNGDSNGVLLSCFELAGDANPKPSTARVNQQPPMHQFRMRPFKPFWEWTKNTSSPAQGFWFFQPLLCPKVFPSYLPTSPHFALTPSSKLRRAWNERAKEGGQI